MAGKADAVITNQEAFTLSDITEIKTSINLQNVDNTSDANKPISTLQATAINQNATDISTIEEEQITQNDAIALNTAKVGVTNQEANTIDSEPIGNEAQVLQVVSISQANYDLITPVATTFYIING